MKPTRIKAFDLLNLRRVDLCGGVSFSSVIDYIFDWNQSEISPSFAVADHANNAIRNSEFSGYCSSSFPVLNGGIGGDNLFFGEDGLPLHAPQGDQRASNCFFRLHSSLDTGMESRFRDSAATVFAPFNQSFCFSKCCEKSIGSTVSSLLFLCRPAAVLRRIGAVIVDSIKTQSDLVTRGECPIDESSFGQTPVFADSNTSCPVVLKQSSTRVVATLLHVAPSLLKFLCYDWISHIDPLTGHLAGRCGASNAARPFVF